MTTQLTDSNQDGRVTVEECVGWVLGIGQVETQEEAEAECHQVDLDGDGSWDKFEYCAAYEKYREEEEVLSLAQN